MTAAELERRLTMRELIEWSEFERSFGPFTLHERIDAMAQQIAYTVHASMGGKERPEAFAVQWRSTEPIDMVAWLRMHASAKKARP